MPNKIEQIMFSANVAALTRIVIREIVASPGTVIEVTYNFPLGCNSLVDARTFIGTKQISPREGWLALNDANPSYPFSEPVPNNEWLSVDISNTDAANPHNITVTIFISRNEEEAK